MTRLALYFGSFGNGHYMHGIPGRPISIRPDRDMPEFPWPARLVDSGLLNNGKIKDEPDGRVWWTCGGRPDLWQAFYWWDRSMDKRGASNSGFYVRGFTVDEREQAFHYACAEWPAVVKRQLFPLVLQPKRS